MARQHALSLGLAYKLSSYYNVVEDCCPLYESQQARRLVIT